MVAIFTGAGTGFERGSGSTLGSSGLLGSGTVGRSGEQLFLNAANGNLLISQQDEFLVGRGPDVGIGRTYNSLGNQSDDNGDNWRQSTQRAVYPNGPVNSWGSTVTYRAGDGSEVSYSWNGSAYVATDGAGAHDKITFDGSVFRRVDGDTGTVETYEYDGVTQWRRLKTITDTSGNSLTYGYTGDKLTSITTANGEQVTYTWSGNHITQVDSGDGTLTRYYYDGYDRLSQVDTELTNGGAVYSTYYTYYGTSKLVATVSEKDGSKVSIAYDEAGRVSQLYQTVDDEIPARVTNIAYGSGYTTVTDPTGQAITLYYDGNGQLTQIKAPPPYAGGAQQVMQFAYNGNGDLSSATDAMGQQSTFTYDGNGNVLTATDRLGNVVTRTYNAANQVLTETRIGSDKDSGAAAHTTRFVYDGAGRLCYTISAEGDLVEYDYDGFGRLYLTQTYRTKYDLSGMASSAAPTTADVSAWIGSYANPSEIEIVQLVYDARSNIVQRISYGASTASGGGATGSGYTHEYFTYDSAGRLLYSAAAGRNAETYVYDGLGRLTAKTDINGAQTSIVFNDAATTTTVTLASGLVQTSTYNKAGELVSHLESGSYVWSGTVSYGYDRAGRVRMMTGASNQISYFLYDKVGRKIADVNGAGWVTEYRYDANDRVVATVNYALATGAIGLLADINSTAEITDIRPASHSYDVWTWKVYDKEGRVIETIEGDGAVTAFEYDASGRLVKTIGYANKLGAGQIAAFQSSAPTGLVLPGADAKDSVARVFYDRAGRMIGTLDGEGYLSRTIYDGAGQKVQEIAYANATNAAYRASGTLQDLLNTLPTGASDRSVRHVYDQQGHLRFTIDALNHVTEYVYQTGILYDSYGLVRETIRYAGTLPALSGYTYASVKSAVGSLASDPANRLSFSIYDDAGRVAYTIDGMGGVVGFIYNAMGQVVRKTEYANQNAVTALYTKAEWDNWAAAYPHSEDRITRYYYSAAGDVKFVIDAEGYVTRNDYDQEGQLVATVRWANAVAADNGWTAGTIEGALSGDAAITNYYYVDGRLTLTTDQTGLWHRYYYYGTGLLAWDILSENGQDDSRTLYVYDQAGHRTAEYAAYGTAEQAITTYSYNGLGDLIAISDPNAHTISYEYDRAGRMIRQTDGQGAPTAFGYNAFGERTSLTNARGFTTYSYFDQAGRVTSIVDALNHTSSTAYNAFGEIATVTSGGATTSFTYDKLGRVLTTTDAEGGVETNWYNAFGNLSQFQNKLGGVTGYTRDRRGLLRYEYVQSPVYDSYGNQTATGYYRNIYEYDARGNVVHQIEAYGLAERRDTWLAYDKANRLISKWGEAVSVGLSPTTVVPTETYHYDTRGNLIESIDAAGARTLFYYDDLDRRIAMVTPAGTAGAPQGVLSTFTYDPVGNLLSSRTWEAMIAVPATAGGTRPGDPGGNYRETTNEYDAADRLIWTRVANQTVGYWNGSSYGYWSGVTLQTHFEYDAVGNLICTTDASGKSLYSYYDAASRKVAQVDQEGYFTRWTLDAEGNVLGERRFATQTSGATSSSYTTPALTADDRVTEFEYDKMGRRTAERRYGVAAWSLNTSNGQLYDASGTSLIRYTYNALGEVVTKTEARLEVNGVPQGAADTTTYTYDDAGRMIQESRPAFSGGTPTIRYYYNALGQLTMTRQGDYYVAGGDRISRNFYGAAGRLIKTTDAENQSKNYLYDAVGRKVGEYYTRELGDGSYQGAGTTAVEGISYEYDLSGNVIRQAINTVSGSSWVDSSYTRMVYNAFGEVTDRGTNGIWQEQFVYDNAGHVIRSNAGDGVWRHYVYDAAGHQTMIVESEGTDISGYSQSQAVAYGTTDGLNATVIQYDGRGLAINTILRQRETSVGSARTDLYNQRGYTAFGEVAWETDAYGHRTDYSYNTMGRVLQIQRPTVWVTAENGGQSTARPTENYFYDIAGRLIGTQDANSVWTGSGVKTTRQLVAGTGYGDGDALVAREWHADGTSVTASYNVFGDQVASYDELGRYTSMAYDQLGRLTVAMHPANSTGSVTDYYAYDILGNRIGHWNNVTGYAGRERTQFDLMGRATLQVAFGGDYTTTSYNWQAGISTGAMGTFGGWLTTTTYINGRYSEDRSDLFGRTITSRDLGGNQTSVTYDIAGRMTQRVSGSAVANYSWLNNGKVGLVTIGVDSSASQIAFQQDRTSYTYDLLGNSVNEVLTRLSGDWVDYGHYEYNYDYGYYDQYWVSDWQYQTSNTVLSSQSASYDSLGRLTYWSAAATSIMPAASTSYEYDANSNIRRSVATFHALDQNGSAYSFTGTQDYWYRYDSMNRVVTAKGVLSGGTIVRGSQGVDLLYDAAGQRVRATTTTTAYGQVYYEYYDPNMYGGWGGYNYGYQDVAYEAENREDYTYWNDGQIKDVRVAQSGYSDNGDGTVTVTAPPATGSRKANYWYDAQGRLERQIDWSTDPDYDSNALNSATYDRLIQYNAKGQVTYEEVFQRQGGIIQVTDTYNDYGSGSSYALGALVSSSTNVWRSQVQFSVTGVSNTYVWYGGAALNTTTVTGTTGGTTTYSYNGFGQLTSAWIQDGRPRGVTFTNDASGQTIRRDEADYVAQGDPHEVWYRFGGRQMGYTGNNGTLDTDYLSSVASRPLTTGTGAFRGGSTYGAAYADFDQFYNPVTSFSQGGAGGSYTVQGGESLQSIAAALWGDSSLWFRLADANGLAGGSALSPGQSLKIPAGVMRSSNTAATFRPYDPTEALGDTSPTTPTPQTPAKAKKNCGVFGAIMLAVVAIAITLVIKAPVANFFNGLFGVTATTAAGATSAIAAGIATGATVGVAASAGSQIFGLATGIQDKFSWKAVAMAGISGGIAGGLDSIPGLDKIAGSKFLGDVTKGLLGNAIGQGVGIATGLQSKFDFAGLAVAGVMAGVGNALGTAFGAGKTDVGQFAIRTAVRTASAIAGAATRSVLEGSDFGDNVIAVLPDVIAQTLGDLVTSDILKGRDSDDVVALRHTLIDGSVAKVGALIPQTKANAELIAAFRDDAYEAADVTSEEGFDSKASKSARSRLDRSARNILEANRGVPAVDELLANIDRAQPVVERQINEITVTGDKDYFAGSLIDGGAIWLGQTKDQVQGAIGDYITKHPAVGIAASFVDTATAAVAPGKYLLGLAVDAGKDQLSGWIASKMDTPKGWNAELSHAGGDGFVFGISIAVQGLGALAKSSGVTSLFKRAARTSCFAAGTPVHTRGGLVAIEALRIGDMVWSRSEHDIGEAAWRQIIDWECTGEQEIYEISVATPAGQSETLRTTETHPFWVDAADGAGSFVIAGELEVGDQLRLADGSAAHVRDIVKTGLIESVYNFSVDGWHTYHVGKLGVWVHNICLDAFRKLYPDLKLSGEAFDALRARIPNARANELAGALRYEQLTGRTLRDGPAGGIDFFYEAGGKRVDVEHLGSLGQGTPWKPELFTEQVFKHALKSTDELVIDVTGMSSKHFAQFDDALARAQVSLGKSNRDLPKIIWIGR